MEKKTIETTDDVLECCNEFRGMEDFFEDGIVETIEKLSKGFVIVWMDGDDSPSIMVYETKVAMKEALEEGGGENCDQPAYVFIDGESKVVTTKTSVEGL